VAAGDGLEGVQEEVERLRRASTWCRNVCTFHGAVRVGGHLCFVMDRYVGSVQAEMRQNGGRLTLEQILRCGIASKLGYLLVLSSLFCCGLTIASCLAGNGSAVNMDRIAPSCCQYTCSHELLNLLLSKKHALLQRSLKVSNFGRLVVW
jgi:hypothetical protein